LARGVEDTLAAWLAGRLLHLLQVQGPPAVTEEPARELGRKDDHVAAEAAPARVAEPAGALVWHRRAHAQVDQLEVVGGQPRLEDLDLIRSVERERADDESCCTDLVHEPE